MGCLRGGVGENKQVGKSLPSMLLLMTNAVLAASLFGQAPELFIQPVSTLATGPHPPNHLPS